MLKDDDSDLDARPVKDIASILQKIPMRSPILSSSGNEEDSAVPPRHPGGLRRFQTRGIEGWVGGEGVNYSLSKFKNEGPTFPAALSYPFV